VQHGRKEKSDELSLDSEKGQLGREGKELEAGSSFNGREGKQNERGEIHI